MIGVGSVAKKIKGLPMLNVNERNSREKKLLQFRMNALTAVFIYSRKLRWISISSSALMLCSILTPVLIILALNMSAGQAYRGVLEFASQLSSAVLLLWSIAVLILKVEVKKEAFIAGRAANNFIAGEALKLLSDSQQDLGWFITYVSRQDSVDQDNLGSLEGRRRKEAYRHSLKQLFPGDASVVCDVCRQSPYRFQEGDCQLCGNKHN